MDENKAKLCKLRGENLKKCIMRYGLKQNDLEVPIDKEGHLCCSESDVSSWVNGRKLLTENKISDLLIHVSAFKDVRKEFLLGDSEYMTEEDMRFAISEKEWKKTDALLFLINDIFKKNGFSLKMCVTGKTVLGHYFLNKDGYYLTRTSDNAPEDPLRILSVKKYFELTKEIEDYTEYLVQKELKKMLEEKGD